MYKIDGKPVRRFLWVREQRIMFLDSGVLRNQAVEVEAFDKDHSRRRLDERYGNAFSKQWEFVCEIEAEETAGMLAEQMKLIPH